MFCCGLFFFWTVEDAGPYEVSFVVGRVHGVPPYECVRFILLSGSRDVNKMAITSR